MNGKQYKSARELRGTQSSVAKALGCDRGTIARRETSARKVTKEAELALLSLPEIDTKPSLRMVTKLSTLCALMRAESWEKALSLASKFSDLGRHKEAITRGNAAANNPALYRQMQRDPELIVRVAIAALKDRYPYYMEHEQRPEATKPTERKHKKITCVFADESSSPDIGREFDIRKHPYLAAPLKMIRVRAQAKAIENIAKPKRNRK